MFDTTAKWLSTVAVGCQTRKTEKHGVSRHPRSDRNELLRHAVKDFDRGDPLIFPNSSSSLKLFLSLAPFSPSNFP